MFPIVIGAHCRPKPARGMEFYLDICYEYSMKDIDLFQIALGLNDPWYIKDCIIDSETKKLELIIDFKVGSKFPCPSCSHKNCKSHDTKEKTWRHLNFFEYTTDLRARVPRVYCPEHGVINVQVPWSRPGSKFTLLFEAFTLSLVKDMPVNAASRILKENDNKLWRVLTHYVEDARSREDYSGVTKVGLDETSRAKGHDYVTIFVDMKRSKVIDVEEGKGSATLTGFKEDFSHHKVEPSNITDFSSDMSPSFVSGIKKEFPDAEITFDKFHLVKMVSEAVDDVRKREQKEHPDLLRKSRMIWLKNPINLRQFQQEQLKNLELPKWRLQTSRAYQIRLAFQEIFKQHKDEAEGVLKKLYYWATHSKIPEMIDVAKRMKKHWNGILRWFESRLNNGMLEGLNSLIQAAKRKARGFRTVQNFKTIIYMIVGKLDFNVPT